MKRILFTFLSFLLPLAIAAQQKTISGRIVDVDERPIAAVSVLLTNDKGTHLKYTKTAKDGTFSLTLPEGKQPTKFIFIHMGFERKELTLKQFAQAKHTIQLHEKVQTIREVEVKPELFRIKGDTIIYSVAGLREKQDRTIEDVIGRIPGMKIDTRGEILFQRKKINKFYVDGKDMMGDNYAMVSRNLSADKVDSVEVLQHHEPTNALRGLSFNEATALNLVLKKDAKGHWNGTTEVGAGLTLQRPWEWNRKMRMVEMYFGKTWQSLNMYKHNNIGEDISSEINGLRLGLSSSQLFNLCGIGIGRSGFNNSHLFATNWFWKYKKNASWRLQLAGFYDKSTSHSYSENTYIDVGKGNLIVQERHANSYTSEYHGELNYTYNGNTTSISNNLSGKLNFNHSKSTTSLNGIPLQERVQPRE